MLDFIFGIMLVFGFLFFIYALEKESFITGMISFLVWLFIWAQSMYVEVPCDTYYSEWTLQALSFGFMIISIILAIYYLLNRYFDEPPDVDEGNRPMHDELVSQRQDTRL